MPVPLVEVTPSGLAYMVIGGFVVAFSMVSLLVKEKLYINEVVLGTAIGVIFGPYCANIFDPRSWGGDLNAITLEIMRITLAAGLFAIGVELPQSYLAEHVKGLLVMVVPTMAFGWLVVAAIIFVVFPPLDFISSLVIAACLTPTDPIISAAIVGGKFAVKHVPLNLRRILAAESAANDGLAYPFLSISIYLTVERSRRAAFEKWFLVGWLYQVVLGTIIGALLGIAFSKVMKLSHRKGYIDRESYVAQYLALALFTIGVTRTLGSDDLLAAFAAGSAISWDGHFNTQIEDEVFSSVIDLVLNCGTFIYIGAWMPFNMFNAPELSITPWRLVVVFIAVLFLRRIPPLLLLYKWVPEIATWREALFSGHFGPMGVGAIFISTLAVTELPEPQSPPQTQAELLAATLQTIVGFVVLGSIIIHGLSIPFFSFGRNVRSRTLSLSRTLTSRQTNTPDWLLWVRRTPAGPAPGTPSTGSGHVQRDVEHGVEGADPSGLTEPHILRQDTTAEQEKKEKHIPELGPAAMIDDATGTADGTRPDASQHARTGKHATLFAPSTDDVNHVRGHRAPPAYGERALDARAPEAEAASGQGSETKTETEMEMERPSSRAAGMAEKRDVNVKPGGPALVAAASNVAAADAHAHAASPAPSVPPSRAHSRNASRVRVVSEGDDLQPPSGAQTPASARAVRFEELEADFERVPSGLCTPTSVATKAVRFPEDVRGRDGDDVGVPLGDGEDSTEVTSGAPALGRNVRFPGAQ